MISLRVPVLEPKASISSLMGLLVGQAEKRTRQALKILDAMAPCVAMIDVVEKAFAGVNGSGDSGVARRGCSARFWHPGSRHERVSVASSTNACAASGTTFVPTGPTAA